MRQIALTAIQNQRHLEGSVSYGTHPFSVVFSGFSVNAQIERGLIERDVTVSRKLRLRKECGELLAAIVKRRTLLDQRQPSSNLIADSENFVHPLPASTGDGGEILQLFFQSV